MKGLYADTTVGSSVSGSGSGASGRDNMRIVQHNPFKTFKEMAAFFAPQACLCLSVCTMSETATASATKSVPNKLHVVVHYPEEKPLILVKYLPRGNPLRNNLRIAPAGVVKKKYPTFAPSFFHENCDIVWLFSRRIQVDLVLDNSSAVCDAAVAAEQRSFVVAGQDETQTVVCSDIFEILSMCKRGRGNQLLWLPGAPVELEGASRSNDAVSTECIPGNMGAPAEPSFGGRSGPEIGNTDFHEDDTTIFGVNSAEQKRICADNNRERLQIAFVSDVNSPLLDSFRDLKPKSCISDGDKVITEGTIALTELLRSDAEVCEILLRLPKYLEHKDAIFSSGKKCVVIIIANRTLKSLRDLRVIGPDTTLASVTQPPSMPFTELQSCSKILALDSLDNAENVGSLIRSAVCFGMDAVILSTGCCSCWNERAVRVSMGHVFQIPIFVCGGGNPSLSEVLTRLRRSGSIETYSAVVQNENKYLHEVQHGAAHPKFVLVMGNEYLGVCQDVRDACETQLKIRMDPTRDSLNVYVAGAILMHHLCNA